MRVLPDTSIWVEYLRAGRTGPAGDLDRLLDEGSVFVCGPVLAELFAGVSSDRRDDLWLALGALPWADLDRTAWRRAGEVVQALRARGHSVPLTDVVIAVACAQADASLWTQDAHFERIAALLDELHLYAAS